MPIQNKNNKRYQNQNLNINSEITNLDFNLIKSRSNNIFNNRINTGNNVNNKIYSNRNIPIKGNNQPHSSDKNKSKSNSVNQNYNTFHNNNSSKRINSSHSNSHSKKTNHAERPTTAPQNNNMPKISKGGKLGINGMNNFGLTSQLTNNNNGFNSKFMGNMGVRGFSGPTKRLASPMVYMTQTSGFSGQKNNGKYRLSSPNGMVTNQFRNNNHNNIMPLKKKH